VAAGPQPDHGSLSPHDDKSDGSTAASRAPQLNAPVTRPTPTTTAQRGLPADTALRLGHWFGTSPEYWLSLQKLYELRLAQAEAGEIIAKLPTRTGRKPSRPASRGRASPRLAGPSLAAGRAPPSAPA